LLDRGQPSFLLSLIGAAQQRSDAVDSFGVYVNRRPLIP
jgi:hypothetical protein